jgi:hypothetical protein
MNAPKTLIEYLLQIVYAKKDLASFFQFKVIVKNVILNVSLVELTHRIVYNVL